MKSKTLNTKQRGCPAFPVGQPRYNCVQLNKLPFLLNHFGGYARELAAANNQ
jgi:hypothetical protein